MVWQKPAQTEDWKKRVSEMESTVLNKAEINYIRLCCSNG